MGIRDVLADRNREARAREAFGRALKEARLEKGWTQEMAGRAVGVSRGAAVTFNQWENGKTFPNTERLLIAIRDELGVDARLVMLQAGVLSPESGGGEKRKGTTEEKKGTTEGTEGAKKGERGKYATGAAAGIRISDGVKNRGVLEAFNRLDKGDQDVVKAMIERLDGKGKGTKGTKK